MEDSSEVVETSEESLEKNQSTTEKFVVNKIRKNRNCQTVVVQCVDPDILITEMKKKSQGRYEKSIDKISEEYIESNESSLTSELKNNMNTQYEENHTLNTKNEKGDSEIQIKTGSENVKRSKGKKKYFCQRVKVECPY